jgi:hypothetical protein
MLSKSFFREYTLEMCIEFYIEEEAKTADTTPKWQTDTNTT